MSPTADAGEGTAWAWTQRDTSNHEQPPTPPQLSQDSTGSHLIGLGRNSTGYDGLELQLTLEQDEFGLHTSTYTQMFFN